MKKFVFYILTISVFFAGLGSLVEHVGARFKSDEKALDIVRRARVALGGDAALAEVRSMVITGRTVNTIKIGGTERSEPGETEIALQLPDKLSQKIMIGKGDGAGTQVMSRRHDVIVMTKDGEAPPIELKRESGETATADGKRIIIRERVPGDAAVTGEDGKQKVIVRQIEGGPETGEWKMKDGDAEKHVVLARAGHPGAAGPLRQNELLRLSLALLLTAPDGIEVNYTFAGETDIDGTAVNIVNAEFGGSNYKLYIGKSNNLPVAMSYRGLPAPRMIKFDKADVPSGEPVRDNLIFTKKLDGEPEQVERLVKFSDYRTNGGVQLPYRWTTTVAGATSEVFDITSYDLNPANIAEKFADQKVFVRMKKADGQ